MITDCFVGKNCGAAGIRTLVQTKHLKAFYMLSFYFDCRHRAGIKANLTLSLASEISAQNRSMFCTQSAGLLMCGYRPVSDVIRAAQKAL